MQRICSIIYTLYILRNERLGKCVDKLIWFVEVSPLAYGGVGLACDVGVPFTVTDFVGVKGGVSACL